MPLKVLLEAALKQAQIIYQKLRLFHRYKFLPPAAPAEEFLNNLDKLRGSVPDSKIRVR